MMYTTSVCGINDLLHNVCNAVLKYGQEVTVRNQKTWELHPAIIEITDPTDRTLLYPHRGNSPFATLFETIWVLGSPCNKIETLAKFLPRAYDYSDNGRTWRAGYPNRLKNFGVEVSDRDEGIDQIDYVYRKLKDDPFTRQAVITIWNPMDDTFSGDELKNSNDFPCSNYLHFMIRGRKLDCMFVIRSNDVIYGCSGINFYEFTVLQEILASLLQVEIGNFYYIIDSLHIYEEYKEKALQLATTEPVDYMLPRFKFGVFDYSWDEYQEKMDFACRCIDMYVEPMDDKIGVEFFEMIKLCQLYLQYVDKNESAFDDFCDEMKEVRFTDLHCACMFWFMKHWKLINPIDIAKAIEASHANCSDNL